MSYVAVVIAVFGIAGCRGTEARLQQHQEQFQSLSRTAVAVGEAWLAGQVSGTYAWAAFDRTFALVEEERAKLAGRPDNLLDPRGGQLSQSAERISRILAALAQDVTLADADSMRRHLHDLHPRPERQ